MCYIFDRSSSGLELTGEGDGYVLLLTLKVRAALSKAHNRIQGRLRLDPLPTEAVLSFVQRYCGSHSSDQMHRRVVGTLPQQLLDMRCHL